MRHSKPRVGVVAAFDPEGCIGTVHFIGRRDPILFVCGRGAEPSVGDRIEVARLPGLGELLRLDAQVRGN